MSSTSMRVQASVMLVHNSLNGLPPHPVLYTGLSPMGARRTSIRRQLDSLSPRGEGWGEGQLRSSKQASAPHPRIMSGAGSNPLPIRLRHGERGLFHAPTSNDHLPWEPSVRCATLEQKNQLIILMHRLVDQKKCPQMQSSAKAPPAPSMTRTTSAKGCS